MAADSDCKDRENGNNKLSNCVEQAIDRCIEEGVLSKFLTERRSEVVEVITLNYTFERQLELERIESHAEGLEEGKIRKTIQIISKKVNKQKSLEQTAMDMEESPEDIRLLYEVTQSYAPSFDEDQIYQTYLEKIQEKR